MIAPLNPRPTFKMNECYFLCHSNPEQLHFFKGLAALKGNILLR
jgi:hypothetical protein